MSKLALKINISTDDFKRNQRLPEFISAMCGEIAKTVAKQCNGIDVHVSVAGAREVERSDLICPTCGTGVLREKKNPSGQLYYGCENYPVCKHTSNLVEKLNRRIPDVNQ